MFNEVNIFVEVANWSWVETCKMNRDLFNLLLIPPTKLPRYFDPDLEHVPSMLQDTRFMPIDDGFRTFRVLTGKCMHE